MDISLGALPSPYDYRDYVYPILQKNLATAVNTPSTYDMRLSLTKVRDQGKQGTCAAQTGACIKEFQENKDINYTNYMSPQFIYNNRINYPADGMTGRDVMNILKNKGVCREYTFPYNTKEYGSQIPKSVFEEASNFKVKVYARVIEGDYGIDNLKQALYENGPCYISFPVYNYGKTFWNPRKIGDKILGGHAVTVIGYNTNGFIIRNSWGTSWGDNGYTYYSYKDFSSSRHWEIWTTSDDKSKVLPPTPQKCCILL